jgi:hypothetical protein
MAAETAATRQKTRRVKDHILDRYLKLADRVVEKGIGDLSEKEAIRYEEMTDIFAKSVLPRTQELGGDPDNPNPIPIYGGNSIQGHNGDQKDIPAQEENQGG